MGERALKAFYQGILIKNRAENDGKFFEMLAFLFCKQGNVYISCYFEFPISGFPPWQDEKEREFQI